MDNIEFTKRAIEMHGNKYDYSKVKYKNNHTKVCIICPEHGEFWQTPKLHLKGSGCPKCSAIKGGDILRDTTDSFINKSRNIHGDKYDYSKVKYINSRTPVCIICPIHGEFWQTPTRHLNSKGCVKCATEDKGKSKRSNTNEFIKKCINKFGDKYDYSKVKYINSRTPVHVICKKHGSFEIKPLYFLHNGECPKCMSETKNTIKKISKVKNINKNEIFIRKARQIHGDKYDYSRVEYKNNKTKVCIICPIHGEFWQKPIYHLKGCGCTECGKEKLSVKYALTKEQFIEKAQKVHSNKYDYSKVEYKNNSTKVCIICPKHGEFWQTPAMHYNEKQGCPLCGTLSSNDENEIYKEIVNDFHLNAIQREHKLITPKELDIYIPDKKVAIEYNGIKWHTEEFGKDKNYHYNKMLLCKQKGIQLISIFSDEYLENKFLVIDKLSHLLHKDENKQKIYARKCDIREIDKDTAQQLLDTNHIQGYAPSSVYLGCFYNDNLVGVMTFKKETKNSNKWELNRFATDITKHCIGVGGKLFDYFVKHYNPFEVKSFADRRWTSDISDNLYTKLGFKLDKILPPDYKYYCKKYYGEKRVHKFNFRKQILHKKFGFPLTMTEKEMCNEIGAYRIWDCGLIKYVWKK